MIDHCLLRSVPIVPGVATPTDIDLAMSFGLDAVKFFPAENLGGTATLKALSGPYAEMMFLPTGGITPEKLPEYLKLPYVLACGGSWLAPATHSPRAISPRFANESPKQPNYSRARSAKRRVAVAPDVQFIRPKIQMWNRLRPAISLFLIAPLIAEYLLGSLSFSQLFFPSWP